MQFRFRKTTFAKQKQGKLVGGCKLVGIERNETPEQRFSSYLLPLNMTDLVQYKKCHRAIWGQLEHVKTKGFGRVIRVLLVCRYGPIQQRDEMSHCLVRRDRVKLQAAATLRAEAAAASAQDGDMRTHRVAGQGTLSIASAAGSSVCVMDCH